MNWRFKNQFLNKVSNTSRTCPDNYRDGSTLHLLGTCLLVSLFACHDKAALKQALIEKTIKEKIANHQQKKIANCTKEALAEAVVIADSVMIKLALSNVDTSGRGNRPAKPARPELSLPVDTTPIKPLFEDSIVLLEETTTLIDNSKLIKADTLEK